MFQHVYSFHTIVYDKVMLCLWISILFSACNTTKNLQEGEVLYNKTNITFEQPKVIHEKTNLELGLLDIARPKPNTKSFSLIRFQLWVYQNFGNGNRKKSLGKWLKRKLGEPPSLYKKATVDKSSLFMEKYLQDNGYFRATVTYDTEIKHKKANVNYRINANEQYRIAKIDYPKHSGSIGTIITQQQKKKTSIKVGDPYNLNALIRERERLTNAIRNQGYFHFDQRYLYYIVDTTLANQQVGIYFRYTHPTDTNQHRRSVFNDIYIYPDYSLDQYDPSLPTDTIRFRDNLIIVQQKQILRPKVFDRSILIDRGELFGEKKHDVTISHLLDLGVFKFVNVWYEEYKRDSLNWLDSHIYLTPTLLQQVNADLEGSTRTGNYVGSSISTAYRHQNLFKGAEEFNISLSSGVETQLGDDENIINIIDITGQIDLAFPRFMVPFPLKKQSRYFVPKTRFGIRNNFQRRLDFYTLNTFELNMGYEWKRALRLAHRLQPVIISRFRLQNTTERFDNILSENRRLQSSFDDVFILGNKYTVTYTTQSLNPIKNYIYLKGSIELSGNLAYLAYSLFNNNESEQTFKFLGLPFSQYALFDVDTRYHYFFNKKSSLAFRLIGGLGIPYGNGDVLPYSKQFSIGGTTSIRAFRLRTLGPGSYFNPRLSNAEFDFVDQTGEIKLEANVEYRFDALSSFLEGALFVDAGNIWLLRDNTDTPNGVWTKNFYRQIAIGAGLGMRIDFGFFLLRVDAAFPLRQPVLNEGMQWTFNRFRQKGWIGENVVYNLAIGYPF